jgi:hypothetical protein
MINNLNIDDFEMELKNSETGDDSIPNAIEYYYKEKYKIPVPSSSICPSCKKKMFRKKGLHNDKDVMVGGHVESTIVPALKYLLPICKECNDKKTNLAPFKAKRGHLLSLGKK